jgi:carboxypeptidase C (cathepsin A)
VKEKGAGAADHGGRDHAGGKVVTCRATAGYPATKDAKTEKTKANSFVVAFTKLGTETAKVDPAKRALTFAFNGGPGSASIWLHMGALGPKRVGMKANGESLPPPDPRAEIWRIRCFCRPPPRARGITTSAVAP